MEQLLDMLARDLGLAGREDGLRSWHSGEYATGSSAEVAELRRLAVKALGVPAGGSLLSWGSSEHLAPIRHMLCCAPVRMIVTAGVVDHPNG